MKILFPFFGPSFPLTNESVPRTLSLPRKRESGIGRLDPCLREGGDSRKGDNDKRKCPPDTFAPAKAGIQGNNFRGWNRLLFFPSQRGAALISVLALSALIASILPLILSDIQLEYAESRHKLNQLRATYNARSAAELSLLRVLIYKEAQRSLQKNQSKLPKEIKEATGSIISNLLDTIWRSPIAWPLPVPEDLLVSEKKEIRKLTEESLIRGSYLSQIQPENGKVDINGLVSALEPIRSFTYDILANLLLLKEEEERGYTEKEVFQVLDNLTDWIDSDQTSRNGGVEASPDGAPFPNRSLISIGEIQFLPSMTDPLYTILKSHTTAYGSKGLNINYAQAPLLQALSQFLGLPLELTEEILIRTNPASEFYQRFQDVEEFCEWLRERGTDICRALEDQNRPRSLLQFDNPSHFRIQATGQFKTSRARVESLTYDANQATIHYQTILEAEKKRLNPPPPEKKDPPGNPPSDKQKKKKKVSPPYKTSSPLLIRYWKEGP